MPINIKTGEIRFTDLNHSVFFKITETKPAIIKYLNNPDIIISGKSINLLKIFLSKDQSAPTALFTKNNITISGDISVLGELNHAIKQIEFDWEGYLANITGDFAAFHIGKNIKNSLQWIQNVKQSRLQDLTLYLQEEIKTLPTLCELNMLYDNIDDLRDSVDRLEIRIKNLCK